MTRSETVATTTVGVIPRHARNQSLYKALAGRTAVLPATPANKRPVSLTARHPRARVVDNAMAFLRASQSETRTTTVRTG